MIAVISVAASFFAVISSNRSLSERKYGLLLSLAMAHVPDTWLRGKSRPSRVTRIASRSCVEFRTGLCIILDQVSIAQDTAALSSAVRDPTATITLTGGFIMVGQRLYSITSNVIARQDEATGKLLDNTAGGVVEETGQEKDA